jgi:hypothetical protein
MLMETQQIARLKIRPEKVTYEIYAWDETEKVFLKDRCCVGKLK